MSASPTRQRFGPAAGLAIALFAVVLLAVGAVVAVGWIFIGLEAGEAAERDVSRDLGGSQAVQTALQQERYQRLNLMSRLFQTDQILIAYLTEAAQERNEQAVLDSLEEYQDYLSFDIALVVDLDGRVLTRTDRISDAEDLSGSPLFRLAVEESKAQGVWSLGDDLYHAMAVPLTRQFENVGVLVVAYAINNGLARQVEKTGGAEVTYLIAEGGEAAVAASTLDAGLASALVAELQRGDGGLGRVLRDGDTVTEVEVTLDGAPWLATVAPLRDAEGATIGAFATATSVADKLAGYRLIRTLLVATAAIALPLAFLLTLLLANRALRPIAVTAEAAERGASGQYDTELPKVSGPAARITAALGQIFATVRERQAADFVTSRVARFLPEPAREATHRASQATPVALLAVELRRFADPKIGYDAEESVERLARDLQRIRASTLTHKGRVASMLGHRILTVFDGENPSRRALAAATEIVLTLSERENVFDEENPPVVAMTTGTAVVGTLGLGDRPQAAVAGAPVKVLEGLLREARPGSIYFSRPVWDDLGRAFHQAQADVKAQRSALGADPLYLVSGDDAAKVTGARALSETTTQFPGDGKALSDVRPGSVLGNRFEILAELGAGRMGIAYKARDRDTMDFVTLKLLRPEVVQDQTQFEKIRAATLKARSIQHPNVLQVRDFGEAERLPYISSEFVRGMTLGFMLGQARGLPLAAVVRFARQIAWGLGAAHGHQLMHGSLKPDNVLIEGGGTVRLMDFGLAGAPRPGMPQPAPQFLAPEQLAGGEADSRADFYAWGVLTYVMATGEFPFPGATSEEIRGAMSTQEPAAPSTLADGLPKSLEDVLLRSLAVGVDDRYQTIDRLIADLDDVVV
ncbi:MAG: protein kinase [Acidobacteriota bacterium]